MSRCIKVEASTEIDLMDYIDDYTDDEIEQEYIEREIGFDENDVEQLIEKLCEKLSIIEAEELKGIINRYLNR